MSFNEQFDQDGAWRQEFAGRLKLLARWMEKQGLRDVAVEERLRRLEAQACSDKVMVAFMGEFSRGKSELINAIFLQDTGAASCLPALAAPPCAQPRWAMTRTLHLACACCQLKRGWSRRR